MKVSKKKYGRWIIEAIIVGLLIIAYGVFGYYFRVILRTGIVYTHFAYIPIVLAGLWWGRRSVLVALILAGTTFSLHFIADRTGEPWSDLARSVFFVIVAFCVGLLSEKVIKTQKALRASEEKYKSLIDKSLAGIFVHRDSEILFVNSRFSEMLQHNAEELLNSSIWELIFEPDRKNCCELISKQAADARHECRFVSKDEKIIWADVASSKTLYEGEPASIVNVYDITDRKEAEEKRQELMELARRQAEQLVHSTRLAELGEMAASIAHELNQPLTGIKNFAQNTTFMIEENAGSEDEIKNNLRRITEQVDRASRIINQMRHLTRKIEPQFILLDVNSTLRESVEFLNPQFKLHGIKVELDLAENIPSIIGDKIRLEQVFLNILTNARQAMESVVEGRLGVKTYFDHGANCPVVVEISDTGMGFTPEESEKLFTPFYSTKKVGDGTGLGLSISLTIIKEHKGELEAVGAPGVGAIFKVMLPAANQEAARG